MRGLIKSAIGFYGMAGLLLELLQKIKREDRPYFGQLGIRNSITAAICGATLMKTTFVQLAWFKLTLVFNRKS